MNTITPSTIEKARWVRFTYLYERAYYLGLLQATVGPVTLNLPSRGILETWDGMVNGRVDPRRSIWYRTVALANSHGADPVHMVRALFYHLEVTVPPLPCELLGSQVIEWESTYLDDRRRELVLELQLHFERLQHAIAGHGRSHPTMPECRVRYEVIGSSLIDMSPIMRWLHAIHAGFRDLARQARVGAFWAYIREIEAWEAVLGSQLPEYFKTAALRYRAKLVANYGGPTVMGNTDSAPAVGRSSSGGA